MKNKSLYEIAQTLIDGSFDRFKSGPAIMDALGYETERHAQYGIACRIKGSGDHYRAIPKFNSADEFFKWTFENEKVDTSAISKPIEISCHLGRYSAEISDRNHIWEARSKNIGQALWALFLIKISSS